METLKGISASPGIAINRPYFYIENENISIPMYIIEHDDVEMEILRFQKAVTHAERDLLGLKEKVDELDALEDKRFIDAHILMLRDPTFFNQVNRKIQQELRNVESIVDTLIKELVEKMQAADDQYLRERSVDLHDVGRRLMDHLLERKTFGLGYFEDDAIIVAHDLMPSDTLGMDKQRIKGIALDAGGRTSHTAILARSFNIPAVLGLSSVSRLNRQIKTMIVDGYKGTVIVDPDEATLQRYRELKESYRIRTTQMTDMANLPAETTDGKRIGLKANIEIPEELESVLRNNTDGIGLFRSEFLFMQGRTPDENEQYALYREILEKMGRNDVTVRTLDIGGDKLPGDFDYHEKNPLLGWRAVRYCMDNQQIFRTQLRALFRASVHGNLRIMFPLISCPNEFKRILDIVDEVRGGLSGEGVPFDKNVKIGTMIEVPSAAMTSDILAKKADFFSIGTNDLIQYTLAVDRSNEKVGYLYEPFHPSILRLIKMIIENAHRSGLSVTLCGEMSADPYATVILIGLGLDEFSMSPIAIQEIKRIIRSISFTEAEEFVGTVLDMRDVDRINQFVKSWTDEHFDFLLT